MRRAPLSGLVSLFAAVAVPAPGVSARASSAPAILGPQVVEGRSRVALRDEQDPDPRAVDAARERAHHAQRDFERERRRAFPRGAWYSGRCDELVGRFCLTHEGDDEWTPVPDPPAVVEGRARLLATLDSAAGTLPGDEWIIGQRVGYGVEAGEPDGALAVAHSCAGRPWWCAALEGYVLHHEGRTEAAEAAFDRALAALPPAAACRWRDVSDLLEGDDRSRYRDLACGSPERAAFERELWLLSDPSWAAPGLERRAEHLARRVRVELQRDAASGYGVPWGRDLEELTIRYGWPAGWDVDWRHEPGLGTERSIEAHRPASAQRFMALDVSRPDEPTRWKLEDDEPRSAWAPPGGVVSDTLAPQIAVFRRGGRRLVVAALDPPADCARHAGVYLASRHAVVARDEGEHRVLRALEPSPWEAEWVGVETACAGRPGRARARRPLPAGAPWLSDILLFEPGQALPGTLDAALDVVRGSNRVRPGESVGVFWEWYAPPGAASVTVELTRENRSFLRKALEWTGLADHRGERAGVRWTDPGAVVGRGRAIRLELPDLPPGQYRLTLQVQSARVGRVLATRELIVER